MTDKYFDITIKNDDLGERSYTFYFIENPFNNVIAKDDCSNTIISDSSGVFIYVNDADEDQNYIKLFDNLDEFYSSIVIYDQVEFEKRLDDIDYEPYDQNRIPSYSMLISEFVKALGGKRINNKYKEGSYYNVTKAYTDRTLTEHEFKMLITFGMFT